MDKSCWQTGRCRDLPETTARPRAAFGSNLSKRPALAGRDRVARTTCTASSTRPSAYGWPTDLTEILKPLSEPNQERAAAGRWRSKGVSSAAAAAAPPGRRSRPMSATARWNCLSPRDAASEGLNLQPLETLINIDLPWNLVILEQCKGRIDCIGQLASAIDV